MYLHDKIITIIITIFIKTFAFVIRLRLVRDYTHFTLVCYTKCRRVFKNLRWKLSDEAATCPVGQWMTREINFQNQRPGGGGRRCASVICYCCSRRRCLTGDPNGTTYRLVMLGNVVVVSGQLSENNGSTTSRDYGVKQESITRYNAPT